VTPALPTEAMWSRRAVARPQPQVLSTLSTHLLGFLFFSPFFYEPQKNKKLFGAENEWREDGKNGGSVLHAAAGPAAPQRGMRPRLPAALCARWIAPALDGPEFR
jgi:hypothetical protein